LQNYNLRNITIFNTLTSGMISIDLKPKDLTVNGFRKK